jgi:hypothetical protein
LIYVKRLLPGAELVNHLFTIIIMNGKEHHLSKRTNGFQEIRRERLRSLSSDSSEVERGL